MTIARLLLLVFGLAHLRGCFTPLCDAVRGYETKVIHTRTGDRVLTDAALTKEGLIVDMAMSYLPPGEYHHTVVRVDETYGPQELVKFKLISDHFGSGVVASGESWWYSVAGRRTAQEAGVFFATPEVSFVPVEEMYDGDWIPFEGAEPHGLLVGHVREGLRAVEVTRGGVKRQWQVRPTNTVGHRLRDAERLPDGSIALVAIHDKSAVTLEILDQEKEPESFALHDFTSPVRVTTAVADDGMLAVVIETNSGQLEAAVFDPLNPGELKWQVLTTKEAPGRYPEVVFHDGKFIAAWLAPQADELRARTFTAIRPGPLAIIAPLLRRGNRIPAISILPDGEEIVFVWREDEVMSRRVPAELAGFSFFERLCALF